VSKPFDATLKHLLEAFPEDWLRLAGVRGVEAVRVVDADLSTVTAEADKVIRLETTAGAWLLHVELQASYDPRLGSRVHRYNTLLGYRHELPVQSVVVLLRPQAAGPRTDGLVSGRLPEGKQYLEFRYDIVRLWEQPVDALLAGGLGTLPLAPLGRVVEDELPSVIRQMEARFSTETDPEQAASLWTATFILMGLRYPAEFGVQLLKGVRQMRESTTYMAILEEGRALSDAEGARRFRDTLLALGTKRFGAPDASTRAAIEAVTDQDRLTELTKHVLDVESWAELLKLA